MPTHKVCLEYGVRPYVCLDDRGLDVLNTGDYSTRWG